MKIRIKLCQPCEEKLVYLACEFGEDFMKDEALGILRLCPQCGPQLPAGEYRTRLAEEPE